MGGSLSFCHLCCTGRGCPWSQASSGHLPGPWAMQAPEAQQESHLLFSAGMGLLPTSSCSTSRDNCSDLHPSLIQLESSRASKPLCPSKLSYLPYLINVYPSQRLTTLLCLWSWTFLFLLCLPMPPGTKAICYFPPPKPWKMPALAGAAILTLLRHQFRHHSEGKKTLGNRGQTAALPLRRRATCYIPSCKLWNKIFSRIQIWHPKQVFAARASTSGKVWFL